MEICIDISGTGVFGLTEDKERVMDIMTGCFGILSHRFVNHRRYVLDFSRKGIYTWLGDTPG